MMPVLPYSFKRFEFIALYRSDHSRALTFDEIGAARAAAKSMVNHTLVLGGINVNAFKMEVYARDQKDAMTSFREMAPGAEIISFYFIDEEKF